MPKYEVVLQFFIEAEDSKTAIQTTNEISSELGLLGGKYKIADIDPATEEMTNVVLDNQIYSGSTSHKHSDLPVTIEENRQTGTVWRVSEADVRMIIQDKYPDIEDSQVEELVDISYSRFVIEDWYEHLSVFLDLEVDDLD